MGLWTGSNTVQWTYNGVGGSTYGNTASRLDDALRSISHAEGKRDAASNVNLMLAPIASPGIHFDEYEGIALPSRAAPSHGGS
jgi:hypothetical protein